MTTARVSPSPLPHPGHVAFGFLSSFQEHILTPFLSLVPPFSDIFTFGTCRAHCLMASKLIACPLYLAPSCTHPVFFVWTVSPLLSLSLFTVWKAWSASSFVPPSFPGNCWLSEVVLCVYILFLHETVDSLRAGTTFISLYPIQPGTLSVGNQSTIDLTSIFQIVVFKSTFGEMCISL